MLTIQKTIATTDWLVSGFLVAAVIGSFAGLNGIKAGWVGTVSAVFGLALKGAFSVTWVYTSMGLIFVGVVLAALASVLLKNKALAEIITGVQRIRVGAGPTDTLRMTKDDITTVLTKTQSKPTQKLVQYSKLHLKLKGTL